jgi:tetratricopeptide (TPR) repeat protein
MKDLEFIDNYFKGDLPEEDTGRFEDRLTGDHEFAEQVALYIATHQVALEQLENEKKERFRQLYYPKRKEWPRTPVRKLWHYVAAAAVIIGVVIAVELLLIRNNTPDRMADRYINEKFEKLSVTMDVVRDSLQTGLNLYNENKLPEALKVFENIIKADSTATDAKMDAGIVCLVTKDYDKALMYFSELESQPARSNPALLYQALTFMKRNQPGDRERAKQLLLKVKQQHLTGSEIASEWLNKWPA